MSDAAIGHALRGGGIASVLSYQVVEHVRAKRLELLLPRFEPPPLPIHVVYAGARLHAAATRAFVDLAAAQRWSFLDLG